MAINGQENFKAGQRVITRRSSGRAVKSVALVCNTADKANKRYCNGATTKEKCEATGFYVRKSNFNLKIYLNQNRMLNSNANQSSQLDLKSYVVANFLTALKMRLVKRSVQLNLTQLVLQKRESFSAPAKEFSLIH